MGSRVEEGGGGENRHEDEQKLGIRPENSEVGRTKEGKEG
jgi:hypothetical protein